MLRTNLSTRPFYNDRAVRLFLGVAIALVTALTAYNALQLLSSSAKNSELTGRVQAAEAATAQAREQARTALQALDKSDVAAVQDASREANLLIERRAFSWTDLFNKFEHTLPADVRIASVDPQIDRDGRMLVAVSVLSRRAEDLHTFMDQLELAGGFVDVLSRQEERTEDGLLRSTIQGYYPPTTAWPAETAAPASGPSSGGNRSPSAPAADAPARSLGGRDAGGER